MKHRPKHPTPEPVDSSTGLPNRDRKKMKRYFRSGIIISALFLLFFFVMIIRQLYKIQVTDHRVYAEMAANQQMRRSTLYPPRGQITSANGETMAMTTYVYDLGITPSVVRSRLPEDVRPDKTQIAQAVARILELDEAKTIQHFLDEEAVYVPLKNRVPKATYDELKAYLDEKKIGGFAVDTGMQRYYPQESLASQVVGFANKQDVNISGVTGVEAFYNNELSGEPGYSYSERDNRSQIQIPGSEEASIEQVPAKNLQLTIDTRIQRIVEELTYDTQAFFEPEEGVSVIVMDPHTGAILAMAGGNNYDLNQPAEAPEGIDPEDWDPNNDPEDMAYMTSEIWGNRSTQISYEVGSTMKVFTGTMALEEFKYKPGEKLSNEPIWVEGWDAYPISSSVHVPMKEVTLAEALRYSLNPPFVILAQRLGIERFYDYVHALGFRNPTGIDLPGEAGSQIHTRPEPIDLATFSFGEQSTMTPIQLANGYAVIANGGELVRPHVGQALLDDEGRVVEDLTPEPLRRVFSEEATAKIRELMTGVPTYGTGPDIYVPGYHVAAKTGTSTHGDDEERAVITVGSMTPAQDPKYVIVTTMFVPKNKEGSWPVAALNRKINEAIGPLLGVKPQYNEYDLERIWRSQSLNRITGGTRFEGERIIRILGYDFVYDEGSELDRTITDQYPPAHSPFGYRGTVWVGHENKKQNVFVEVPDFTGLTFEEAWKLAEAHKLNVRFLGTNRMGPVTSQNVCQGMDVETISPSADPTKSTKGLKVRQYSIIDLHFDGTGQEGPKNDGSILEGFDIPQR